VLMVAVFEQRHLAKEIALMQFGAATRRDLDRGIAAADEYMAPPGAPAPTINAPPVDTGACREAW
jgi:hypothetical protein